MLCFKTHQVSLEIIGASCVQIISKNMKLPRYKEVIESLLCIFFLG
jgi:hypothetical protein